MLSLELELLPVVAGGNSLLLKLQLQLLPLTDSSSLDGHHVAGGVLCGDCMDVFALECHMRSVVASTTLFSVQWTRDLPSNCVRGKFGLLC